jgi:hypothetical protein
MRIILGSGGPGGPAFEDIELATGRSVGIVAPDGLEALAHLRLAGSAVIW